MRRSGGHGVKLPSVRGKMSVDGTKLLFEGFLQKRKDNLKIRWVTYWFRLQNTTLFFYTKKNGSASHLRGYYYIYTVQSVREVHRTDKNHFLFEIIMTNGKKKMLAAETAALRKEWVGHLWQAMHLSSSGLLDSRDPDLEMFDQRGSLSSNMSISLCSDSVREVLPARRLSSSSEHIYSETEGLTSSICPPAQEDEDSDDATYQNLRRPLTSNKPTEDPDQSTEMRYEEQRQDALYDVLPGRKSTCEAPSTQTHDAVYDFPLSYKTSSDHQDGVYDVPVSNHKGRVYNVPVSECKDAVYDVPAHLLRKKSDHAEDEQPEEGTYWRI
ncbi:uncharacterized protein LOC122822443 [Gambusia affinis]|uniref:uncharacterized protein LOC122822443 n=1 Tax=Gambusia affinis TaxID=33528 RepID=UPI001CDB8240|nr:uncharacterized protein LOC122822443 [Gambusia affinis]XP_043957046.1 uncharacterized protein LOC122822443 [Gambusia affinis]